MNIFDYAMEIEKEGEKAYRGLSAQSSSNEMKALFDWLAEAELNHYNIFQKMKNQENPSIQESSLLQDAVNIFTEMKKNKTSVSFKGFEKDAYDIVLSIEEKMADFYNEKANEAKDPAQKALFQSIAKEEKQHQHLIENLIKMIHNPETWIQNENFKEILNVVSSNK
ncbi:MAG: ferritin family protein [Candidatus Aceula meridiana]|nr:ferritin family protein [Candidatus Aceula meridiana]